MSTIHKKVWKEYFEKIAAGKKKFELRLADFEVKEGDVLVLEEWDKDNNEYTGRKIEVTATYIIKTKNQVFWPQSDVDKHGFQIIQFELKTKFQQNVGSAKRMFLKIFLTLLVILLFAAAIVFGYLFGQFLNEKCRPIKSAAEQVEMAEVLDKERIAFLVVDSLPEATILRSNGIKSDTKSQINRWEEIVLRFQKEFTSIKYFHISATAGTFFSEQTFGNVARLGIGLYGVNPSPLVKLNLKPVLQMQSVISSLRKLNTGKHVGYNITYQTKQNSTIATVSAGYFEGVDRRLSNCGVFKIGDTYCPIVGRVSMNITSIDVTPVPNVKFGDKVVIISDNADDKNSVNNIAKLTKTIPWEIFVRIPQHLRRIVV